MPKTNERMQLKSENLINGSDRQPAERTERTKIKTKEYVLLEKESTLLLLSAAGKERVGLRERRDKREREWYCVTARTMCLKIGFVSKLVGEQEARDDETRQRKGAKV